jgi:hypothetical protein
MTPEELVAAASPKIGALGSAFYFLPETRARGEELGLSGLRFYFLGRGGVLGDVEPAVVRSAFGYFAPGLVEKMWRSAMEVVPPRQAARAYFEACADLGRRRLADLPDLDAFCAAAGAVNDAADDTALAVYAGIAAEPLAEDIPGRAMQLVTVLREHRAGAHLLAVRAVGLSDVLAHAIHRPDDLASFGWKPDEVPAASEEDRARRAEAERLTDRIVTPAFAVLDDDGARALLDGLDAMEGALAG